MAELLFKEVPTWLPSYANEFTAVIVKSESFDITATSNYMTQARFDSISTRFRIDNKVRVHRGFQGFLISRKGGYGLVLFQITEFAVILPVPLKFLDIGDKFRPLADKIADEFPTVVETQSAKMEAGNLPIEIFIRSLWVTLRGQQDKLRQLGLSDSSLGAMFGSGFFSNVDSITRAMSNQVRDVLGRGEFSIQDLAGLPKATPQWPRAGSWTIYLRLYTKLDPGHVDINNAGIYIGQTKLQIRHRESQHESETNMKSPKPHYRTARRGLLQDRYTIPLLTWAPEDIAALRPIVLEMAEQTMILIFQCYHTSLQTAPREDMVTMDGLWLDQKRQSSFMLAAARDACAATGWKRYPDVNFIGLNLSSPVFELHRALVVTCVFTKSPEPTFRNFYTYQMPRRINIGPYLGHFVTFQYYDGSGKQSRLYFPLHVGAFQGRVPEVGYLVLELMEDGKPHPQPYMGFPIAGPFENFSMPSSLGIKFVWLDEETSQWKTVPCARKTLPKAHEELVDLWKKTMSLIALFHGVEWQGPTHGIQRWSFGVTVKELQINHLKQTCEWIPRKARKVAAPKQAKWVDNCHILTNYLAQFPQTVVNPTDGPIGYAHGYWRNSPIDGIRMHKVSKPNAPCDLCVLSSSNISRFPCDREASFTDGWVCESCFKLNRPCTFTPPSISQQLWGKDPPHLIYAHNPDYAWTKYPTGEFRRITFHHPLTPEKLNTSKDTVEPVGGKLGLWSMEDGTSDESNQTEPTEE